IAYLTVFFFFSSRRRHTRSKRDWSSDVCSSDLIHHHCVAYQSSPPDLIQKYLSHAPPRQWQSAHGHYHRENAAAPTCARAGLFRSEERRVGKEGRRRRSETRE